MSVSLPPARARRRLLGNAEKPYKHSTAELIAIGQLGVHPLAVSTTVSPRKKYPTCRLCDVRDACCRAVIELRPFLRPECNAVLPGTHYDERES